MLNISSNLYKSSWTDLIFKNRNKAYGAYQLRAESSSITTKALLIAGSVFILLFAGPSIYKRLYPVHVEADMSSTTVVDIAPPPVTAKLPEQKMDLPKPEPSKEKLNTVKLPAKIVVTEQPAIDETPPSLDQLENAVVGQVTQSGTATHESATPAAASSGNGEGVAPPTDNTVYDGSVIEKYPEFEGGMAAWAKFIQRNLRYPEEAMEKETQGKVFVSFVVEKDGSISNVSVIKGIGNGCDEEAVRVIKKSPRWKPGQQHNTTVRVRYTMPLAFMLN